ncbi:hypothetical protein ACGFNX_27000 [Streptomyces sp. NPDC048723]|uniref:hypothetical protein n=1 Tax=Streptomyces sp. NPDC048723 TaxID=3365589 RepID=UPI003720499E
MTGWLRACWWGLAVVGVVAAVTLVVWVSVGHPEGADQGWGIAGAVAGIAALGVALWQLKLTAQTAESTVPAPQVSAETGSIAAGGTARNARARDTAPGTGSVGAGGRPGISASSGSVAAGEDVDGASAHHGP